MTYKFMASTTTTHWRTTLPICRVWFMILQRNIWWMRLALSYCDGAIGFSRCFITHVCCHNFSLGILKFAWNSNMIRLFPLEAYTMITQKGVFWSWISLGQLNQTGATMVAARYFSFNLYGKDSLFIFWLVWKMFFASPSQPSTSTMIDG